jgi:nucleoside-diphosphate-sugar epimerase
MKTILVTGSEGQIGSELVPVLRKVYGDSRVIASDIKAPVRGSEGPFERLDVTDGEAFRSTVRKYKADTIIHLAALLSATAETKPMAAWHLNMGGLLNALETARELGCRLFVPSSIGAFGPSTPKRNTPQVTIQRPTTMYGINKAAGELLCDYYHQKFGVDTRGLRFPGLISYTAPPGGGTTDYAVEMYYAAVKEGHYASYIDRGTYLDMMYMPDAIHAIMQLMEADEARLTARNAYNVSAMSVAPETIADAIRKHIPSFSLTYRPDPMRQAIADSWPDSLDTSAAEQDWGFRPQYSLERMTEDMLAHIAGRADAAGNLTHPPVPLEDAEDRHAAGHLG